MYIGGILNERNEISNRFLLKSKDLTTHGMIVGMTGSGKTALGIIMIEELLKEGKSVIAIDVKGDLTNLLLNFPDFSIESFKKWVKGGSDEVAESESKKWREGLFRWGIDSNYMESIKDNVIYSIFTPNSEAGIPLNIGGILSGVKGKETLSVVVDSILSLIGVKGGGALNRESLLLSTIIDYFSRKGVEIGFDTLISAIQDPPFEKIGVFKVDKIYPRDDRMELAFKMNSLVASPYMADWFKGERFNVRNMLESSDGRPRCSIFYIAHLSEKERMFAISLLLSQILTYIRSLSGSDDLRYVLYFDEVFGYVPPYPDNPPTKRALMTLLKQARAFGLGVILSTQNPVDIDYKAIGNMGVWFIGRLITKQDQKRLLDGMDFSGGGIDRKLLSQKISGLKQREFIYRNSKRGEIEKITTRWAISYLRGPITLDEIRNFDLKKNFPAEKILSETISNDRVDGVGDGDIYVITRDNPVYQKFSALYPEFEEESVFYPYILAKLTANFTSSKYGIYRNMLFYRIYGPLNENLIGEWKNLYGFSVKDLSPSLPDFARYSDISYEFKDEKYIEKFLKSAIVDVYREENVVIYVNKFFKMHSDLGESREEFLNRLRDELENILEAKSEKLRNRYGKKLLRLKEKLEKKNFDYEIAKKEYEGRKREEYLSAGESLLSFFLGSRSRTIVSKAARKRRLTKKMELKVKKLESEMDVIKEEIEALETEFNRELDVLRKDIERKIGEIASVKLKLKKSDIYVDKYYTIWLPFGGKVK